MLKWLRWWEGFIYLTSIALTTIDPRIKWGDATVDCHMYEQLLSYIVDIINISDWIGDVQTLDFVDKCHWLFYFLLFYSLLFLLNSSHENVNLSKRHVCRVAFVHQLNITMNTLSALNFIYDCKFHSKRCIALHYMLILIIYVNYNVFRTYMWCNHYRYF